MPNVFKIDCMNATYLISKKQETKLSFLDKLKLKLHMKVCACCNLFYKQMDQFANLLKLKPKENITLSKTKKEEMEIELQKQMQEEK